RRQPAARCGAPLVPFLRPSTLQDARAAHVSEPSGAGAGPRVLLCSPRMTAGSTEARRTSAEWLELLAAGAGEATADAVAAALAGIQAPDPLSARLAFGKLNRPLDASALPADGTAEFAALLG